MDRYIGIDVHAVSSTVVVVNAKGKQLSQHVVETNGRALIECLRLVAGRRHICIEEGLQSAWLYEILAPHAEDMTVMRVTESRGQKSDQRDALGLANKLRLGTIESRVFKDHGSYRTLRELVRVHSMVVRDVVRVQNRLKSFMRSRGIAVAGKAVYREASRKGFLRKLPDGTRAAVKTVYTEYDALLDIRGAAQKQLLVEARKHRITKVLQTCPGIGPIRAAQLLPIVVTPHRFRTKRQFWSYCGLAIVMRSSADWVRDQAGNWQRAKVQATRGLNTNHNHQLKAIFKGAATTVIMQAQEDPLYGDYKRMVDGGTKPNLARLTLARKISAIVLSMWKNEEVYEPEKYRKALSA
jgi:transposase